MSMNHIVVSGRIGADPELRFTQAKLPVLNFSIAHTDWNGKTGESTSWYNVVVFDKAAESLSKRLAKGDDVIVMGKIKVRSYQSKDGMEKKTVEITAFQVKLLANYIPKQSDGQQVESSFTEDSIPF